MTLMQDPIYRAVAVTPSDETDLGPARGLYIGGAGNVAVRLKGDATPVTLTGIAVGVWHPMRVQYVYSTGTTATAIVVGY